MDKILIVNSSFSKTKDLSPMPSWNPDGQACYLWHHIKLYIPTFMVYSVCYLFILNFDKEYRYTQ